MSVRKPNFKKGQVVIAGKDKLTRITAVARDTDFVGYYSYTAEGYSGYFSETFFRALTKQERGS